MKDASKSPYVEGSTAPDFIQDSIEDEFYRYSVVVKSSENSIEGLEVITNTDKSVGYFENMLEKYNLNGKVTIIK